MWNSPHRKTKSGRRYDIRDIAVLTHPLDQMMNFLESSSVGDVVHERILQRMDKEELIFAIYQVLHALLEDDPIPKKGHTGYQEALVAELLYQTHILIGCELDMDKKPLTYARAAAWESLVRLRAPQPQSRSQALWQLEDLKLNLSKPKIYRSAKITLDHWQDMLLGEGGLWDEFLWDDDWRMDQLLDLPPAASNRVASMTGIDLETVYGLPHSPSKAELQMAKAYIQYVIWKDEATSGRS